MGPLRSDWLVAIVPAGLVGALVTSAGCYRTNARAGSDADALDAGAPDATAPLDAAVGQDTGLDAPSRDAPPPRDAGLDAAPPVDAACIELDERSRRFCVLTPTGTVPEGEPFVLPVERSLCLCEGRVCDVAVDGARIDLRIRTCDLHVVCDECTTEVGCVLPPLPRGGYAVWVDGVLAGEISVAPERPVAVATPACWAIPDPPDPSLECVGALVDRPGSGQLCHREIEDVGTNVRFTFTAECGACFDWSAGCEARRESSDTLVVRPRIQACDCPTCGACEPVCAPVTVACETPPLRAGSYHVVIEGRDGERTRASMLGVRDVSEPGSTICPVVP
jgi:hypothetical protein